MLVDTSPPENIVVLSRGASSESGSHLDLEAARKIVLLDGIKQVAGKPLAARELVTRAYLADQGNEPVPIRGIDEQSLAIHRVTVIRGTPPAPGSLELLVGRRVVEKYPSLAIGQEAALPGGASKIVGVMAADGGPIEDEVWTLRSALEVHLNVKFSSSLTIAATSPSQVPALVDKINFAKDLQAQAYPAAKLLEDDARLGTIARVVLVLLALLSTVATFAIATTMSAAVALRMPELASLAAIGIRRRLLGRIVLLESALLALVGALVGTGLGWLIARQVGAIALGPNPVTLDTPAGLLLSGLGLGTLIGVIGGLSAMLRVARLDISQAMR
jgi:putative ABC transport system permease protein